MDHHHRRMLIALERDLILHIHLINGYVAFHSGAGAVCAAAQVFGSLGLTSDEETSLRGQNQRFRCFAGIDGGCSRQDYGACANTRFYRHRFSSCSRGTYKTTSKQGGTATSAAYMRYNKAYTGS